jgi:hypothetical protein
MAAVSTKGVAGIPLAALDAISDENTRQVLAALVEGWHVRNGSTGNGDGRFVTKAELTQQAFKTQQSATNAAGSSSSTQTNLGTIKPGQIAQIINDVQASVFASQLWSDLGSRISLIQIDSTQNAADIKTETQKRINADNAIVQSTTTQFAVLSGNLAAVQQQVTTIANTVSAYSQTLTTLQSQVGNNTSALQIEAATRANADNEMMAKFTVKIDQNGYVSGFGLMSTANNSTPYSQFIVRADQFAIGSPSGPGISPAIPFIVQTTYDSKGNPPGIYMDTAFIKQAAVGTLLIDGNAVTVPASVYVPPSGVTLNRLSNPFSAFQVVGSLTVDFGSYAPAVTVVMGSINLLTTGGYTGQATLYLRIRETTTGLATSVAGQVTASSFNFVMNNALSGLGPGVKTFVIEVTRNDIGFDFYVGDVTLTVLGAKR